MTTKINVGLIGYGYWGNNLLRNLVNNAHTGKITVADLDKEKINSLKSIYTSVEVTTDTNTLLSNPNIRAVAIATPTSSHFKLAKVALLNNKHVLVEKPMCTSEEEVKELIQIATNKDLVLMVDHIYLYNPVVRQLKRYMSESFLGKVNYIDATRINLGIYQNDTNVLWDLACHDLSIINYLLDEKPRSVQAIGRVNPAHGVEDVAYLFLHYPNDILVQINSSWASPVKIRKMIIGGEKRMIIYDDIESTNKLIIYDYAHTSKQEDTKAKLVDYRLGDITIPKYELVEALSIVVQEFYYCISNNTSPIADGYNAQETVRILEKAQESLTLNGAIIPLN